MADLDGYLNGLPFPSNTNDFRTSTHCHFTATSINATTIRVSVEATSGSATSLGTGGNRYRYVYAWIYNEGGAQIGYGSVQIKTENEWWNKNETRTRNIDIAIPFKSGGHVLVTATIDGGLDTNSLRWTNSNKHPEQDTFSWPTYNTAPVAGTASVSPSVFIPGNSVTISWSGFSDSENNIAGYDIDWTTDGTNWNNLIDKPVGTSSMTDFPGVARGSREKYRVRAFDTFGLTSAFAETGWTYANTLPSTPTGVSTSATIVEPGTNIPVSFNASTDTYGPVSYYEIKMQDSSSVDYNGGTPLIICYSSPGYVPTTGWSRGASWKFLVRAVDELGEAGSWSAATSLVKINSIPGAPSGVSITQTMFETGNVTVNFTPGSDADGNASSHEIQYSVSTNKGVSWGGWAAAGTATSTATSFSHALSLNRGEYARYQVRLKDSLGQASSWAISSDYVIKNVLPPAPTAYSVSTIGGGAINTALSYKLTDTIALTATKNEKATPYNVSGFLIASMSFYVYNSAGALISSVLNQTDFAISQTLTSLSMTRGNSYYILIKQKDAAGVLGDATLRYPSSGYININNGPGAFGNVYEQTTQVTLVGANAITPYSGNYISNVAPLSSNLAGGTVNYTFYYTVGGVDYSFATASRATGVSTRIDVTWNFSTYGGPNVLTSTYNSTGTYKIVAIDSEGYSVTKTISITVNNRRSFYSGQTFSPTLTLVRASTAAVKGTTIKEGENFTISIGNFSNSYFYATSTIYWELYYQTSLDNSTFSNDTLITSFSSTSSIVAPYVTPSFTVPTPWTTNSKFYVRYYVKVKNDVLANQVTAYDNTNGKHRVYIWKANPSFSVVSAKRNTGTTMSIVVNLVSIGASSDTNILNDSLYLSATTATATRIGIIYRARTVETTPVTPSITEIAADWSTTTSDGKIEVSGTNYLTTGGLPQPVFNISLDAGSLNATATYDVVPYIVRRATGATASTSFISYLPPIVVKPLGSLFSFSPWGIYIGEDVNPSNTYGSSAETDAFGPRHIVSRWSGHTLAVGGTVLGSAFRPKMPLVTDAATALVGIPYSWNIFFSGTSPATPKLKWTDNAGNLDAGEFDFTALPTGLTAGSTSTGFINYNGTTPATGQLYGGSTNPSATTRLNYGGYLYATKLYSDGTEVSVSGHTHSEYASSSHVHDYLPLVGGTMTGKITGTAPFSYYSTAITGITAAPFDLPLISVGTTARFVPFGHMSASHSAGYVTHLAFGLYKTSTAWFDSGMFIGLGGADANPTEHYLFGYGGGISHSSGRVTVNGELTSTGSVTSNGSLITAATQHTMSTPHGYIQIGPMNTSTAHIYTDRASFYFNKPLIVNGTSVSMDGHSHSYLPLTGGTMTGILNLQNNTSYTTGQARRIIISTAAPSGGGNGDVWLLYV